MPRTTNTEATSDTSEQPAEQEVPVPATEEAQAEPVTGDGTASTSETPAPETPAAEGAEQEQTAPAATEAEEPEAPIEEAPAPATAPAADPSEQPAEAASPAEPIAVQIGHVRGMQHQVPLGDVQALLPEWVDRIEALRNSPSIASLEAQMRASEGRCAPVVFTQTDPTEKPHLFSGIEVVAAAINLGLPLLSVVVVAPGETGALQPILVAQSQAKPANPASPA